MVQNGMAQSLQARLEMERRERFVGREAERALLHAALTSPELPFFVLHVFGPGGIGKTSLLREFEAIGRGAGVQVVWLDGRSIDPSPDFFLRAIGVALNLPDGTDPLAYLATAGGRLLLLLDTYELLAPIDSWLREDLLPRLPGDVLVVLAGRSAPAFAWRSDPGWQRLMRILPLRNLSPDESRDYLLRRSVPAGQVDDVLAFTHGHALALSLVADVYDQRPDTVFRPEASPDVVKTLLEQFVREVPSAEHRAALEACSLVRLTTESLLGAMLKREDAHDLFEWLRGLSFMEADRRGLFPHDLAREALATDVRWRNPDWFAELHGRARGYYMARVRQNSGQEQRRVLADYIFLHRDNPSVRPFFIWQESGSVFTDAFRPDDLEELAEMVRRHEGDDSAALAIHWMTKQPDNVSVLRQTSGETLGFLARVSLERTTAAEREPDPGITAIHAALGRTPLRKGETAIVFRFWMGRDSYQSVSPEQSRLFLSMVQDYLTVPGLAFTYLPCADPALWQVAFQYADLARYPEADFEVSGRRYGVYGHDWRVTPPLAWLELLAERELNMTPAGAAARPPVEPLIILSEADFATAVRDALRDYTVPTALETNPLMRSRLVQAVAGADAPRPARAAALRKLLAETAESLQGSPKTAKYYRALHHTYLQPANTQEQAAEVLDLPFSTYRRHLRSAIEEVTTRLWTREIANLEG
jgi:hypothetical protein